MHLLQSCAPASKHGMVDAQLSKDDWAGVSCSSRGRYMHSIHRSSRSCHIHSNLMLQTCRTGITIA